MLLAVAIVFLTLANTVRCVNSPCHSAMPGMPGIPGIPGKDGRDGQKGAKGESGIPASALGLNELKGEKGVKGSVGPKGKSGPMGPPGPRGDKGLVGLQGEGGVPGNQKRQHQSAFTVARKTAQLPSKNNPVIFNIEITNDHKDYDVTTGQFTCRTSGLYYFVYHASQSSNLCISLYVDGETKASFCDHMSNTHQVTSGGTLVQLLKGQQVWLAVNDYNGMIGVEDNDSVFSGFLVFPD
ncbi:complement C1q subcomponent subunit C isoform X2 [Spea bombifrons]|nr:complement C1q subcomponent subunit C isoform X2 [Spea bombifrons]XP_053308177.1 complement C1q subcomponent subunit C isoform X2 [Spea bombifrons]